MLNRTKSGIFLLSLIFCLSLSTISPSVWANVSNTKEIDQLEHLVDVQIKENKTIGPEIFAELEHLLEIDGNNCRVHLLLGRVYSHLALPDQASEQFHQAAQNLPNDQLEVVKLVQAQINYGEANAAAEITKEARRRFPGNAELNYWQGNYLLTNDKMKEAEQVYIKALQQRNDIIGLPTALAQIRLQQHRYSEAIQLADLDITHDTSFWSGYRVKGLALKATGSNLEAVKALTIAFEHFPKDADVACAFAEAAANSGRYNLALKPALANLAILSSAQMPLADAQELISTIWPKLAPDLAEKTLDQCQLTMPETANFHLALGQIFDYLRLYNHALLQDQRALAIQPNNAQALFRMAVDLELHFHRYDDALRDYQEAHALSPSDGRIEMYLSRLRKKLLQQPCDLVWQLKDWFSGRPAD